MRLRVLPICEWDRLDGTPCAPMLSTVEPDDLRVLVVEDEGLIAGAWVLSKQVHLDGIWVDEDYRHHPGVIGPLVEGMNEVVRAWGASVAVASAQEPRVQKLIQKMGGQKLEGATYLVPVKEGVWAGR